MPQTIGMVGVGIMGSRMCRNLLMFKDLGLFVQSAMESRAAALLAGTALQLYSAARAAGSGRLDQTAVVKELERLAGVELGTLSRE